jgi:hypothetical protein
MPSAPNTDKLTIRVKLEPLTAVTTPAYDATSSERPSLGGKAGLIHRLIREPLVHFLAAGVLLFLAASLVESLRDVSTDIHVSSAEIQRLHDGWTRQYGRPPDARQMQNLIADYIREEVYYREALASGLDKDDTIIRRRLVEKMEFLSQEIASGESSPQELQNYFEHNREKFRIPAQVAFSHLFFSSSRRADPQDDARRALALVRKHGGNSGAALGDPFMLQKEYPLETQAEVTALFGDEFAASLFRLAAGEWQGPIRSTYGWHAVRISQSIPSRLPELAEVRQQVETEFKSEQLQKASDAYYARLRSHYRIHVDDAAFANSSPQSRSSSLSQRVPQSDED